MFGVFTSSSLWSPVVRAAGFWMLTLVVFVLVWRAWAPLDVGTTLAIAGEAARGDIGRVASQEFAFALAAGLAALAAGLLVAHLVMHAALVALAVLAARDVVAATASGRDFAAQWGAVDARLAAHPLLGHAWANFAETLVHDEGVVRNTARPQSFFTYATLREKLAGLKIMPGIPGYFVGIGLLLTFVGLVIALAKAAAGTRAAQAAAGGAGAAVMQAALGELLQAATFKFATSIAGLAASIVLSFFHRLSTVAIESALGAFCEALERRLVHVTPQSLAMETRDGVWAQYQALQGLTGEGLASGLGQAVAPALQAAMAPLSERIGEAVGRLSEANRSGVEDLVDRFSASLQGNASTQLRDLGAGLAAMQGTLEQLGAVVSGSGEDFSRRMNAAADQVSGRLEQSFGASLGRMEDQTGALAASLGSIRGEMESFVGALRSATASLGVQAQAIDRAAVSSRETADQFDRSAAAIRSAVEPVTASSERMVAATESIGEAIGRSIVAIGDSHGAATRLAQSIATQADRLTGLWADYEARFGKVDDDLGRAFDKLATESFKQSQLLAEQSARIDKGLAGALDRLAPFVRDLGEGAGDLAEAVEELKATLAGRPRTA